MWVRINRQFFNLANVNDAFCEENGASLRLTLSFGPDYALVLHGEQAKAMRAFLDGQSYGITLPEEGE